MNKEPMSVDFEDEERMNASLGPLDKWTPTPNGWWTDGELVLQVPSALVSAIERRAGWWYREQHEELLAARAKLRDMKVRGDYYRSLIEQIHRDTHDALGEV